MNMPRRLLALLLLPLLVLAACGGGDDDEEAGGGDDVAPESDESACPVSALEDAAGPVEITYWVSGLAGGNVEAMESMTDAYNSSQQKVKVNLQFQGTYDEGVDKYVTALRGGDLPNAILVEDTQVQLMIDSGSVVPAQACVDAADYDLSDHLPVVIDEFRVEDELWPMPFNVSNPVLYYDTNDFSKAGLDPDDPPATFDDVRAAAEKLQQAGTAQKPMALSLQPWFIEELFSKAGEPVVDNDNGRSGRAENAVLETETGLEVFTFMDELIDDGLATSYGYREGNFDHLLALGKGEASMTIETSASLGTIFAVQEAGQFTDVGVGVAPLPGGTGGGVTVGGGSLWIVAKDKSSEEIAATWDFVAWLNEPAQQAVWHRDTGYVPIRKSAVDLPEVADLWRERPQFRVSYDQLLASEADGGPVIGPYNPFRDAIQNALERMTLEGLAPADAVAAAQEAADAALKDYNDRVG